MNAFPTSFDITGYMPREYTIYLDSNVQPVQHIKGKIPTEGREKKDDIQEMVDQQVTTHIKQPSI